MDRPHKCWKHKCDSYDTVKWKAGMPGHIPEIYLCKDHEDVGEDGKYTRVMPYVEPPISGYYEAVTRGVE